jgi:hypothetical protein
VAGRPRRDRQRALSRVDTIRRFVHMNSSR